MQRVQHKNLFRSAQKFSCSKRRPAQKPAEGLAIELDALLKPRHTFSQVRQLRLAKILREALSFLRLPTLSFPGATQLGVAVAFFDCFEISGK